MPSKSPPHLSADELDDLLYFSRAGSLPDFQATISTSSKRLNTPPHTILLAAVDDTSRNSALHMASANGHTGSVPPSPLTPFRDAARRLTDTNPFRAPDIRTVTSPVPDP